ncbi:MAG: polyhydroxyalkanoate depolymerase [Polyangiaceae bacterium]
MLYRLHELQRSLLDPMAQIAGVVSTTLRDPTSPYAKLPFARTVGANQGIVHRLTKRFEKPPFGIERVMAHGREVHVAEDVILEEPFCELVRFSRSTDDPAVAEKLKNDPKILVCAPLSGHHATLLRDTVRSLVAVADVYITDWIDARDVPVSAGEFRLDDYVHTLERYMRHLGAKDIHVIAVCQPTVPALGAVALLAARGEDTPRSLTLMGGPIDARKNPTQVNELATKKPLSWFEKRLVHKVPKAFAGAGRRVYPGFLQLTAFVAMNPSRHAEAYWDYWFDLMKGTKGEAGSLQHERFYDDYNAVLDMDAAYYLDTVKTVFQEFSLAKGTWDVDGERVRPEAITKTALLTIEGELDDICGIGQSEAAHGLCYAIPPEKKKHVLAQGVGHYGIFSGSKWREKIFPVVHEFVREHDKAPEAKLLANGATNGVAANGAEVS